MADELTGELTDEITCPSCGRRKAAVEMHEGSLLPPGRQQLIQRRHPEWRIDQLVCDECLEEAKAAQLHQMIAAERGSLSALEKDVVARILADRVVAGNENERLAASETVSDSLAGLVADLVGSWAFPALIALFLLTWLLSNILLRPFEPFPTIVFAVISAALASLAALQAPIIMMSQRAQRKRDQNRADNDYRVNLKAELEIRLLTEQVEQLARNQERLFHLWRQGRGG